MNFIDTKSLERALDVYGAITNHEHVAPLMSPSDFISDMFSVFIPPEISREMNYEDQCVALKELARKHDNDVIEYHKKACRCYYEITNHQKFSENPELQMTGVELLIDPHMVDETGVINDDDSKNNFIAYWVEFLVPFKINWDNESSKWHYPEGKVVDLMHDYKLDCGGSSWEEAIITAHELFIAEYGEFVDVYAEAK